MIRAIVAALVVALALAAPTAAFAQGAAGDQYQDPLAGQPGAGSGGGGGGSGGGGSGGGGNGGPSAAATQSGSGAGGTTTSAQNREQLPATGGEAWLLALAGAALVGGGLGLRRAAGARL